MDSKRLNTEDRKQLHDALRRFFDDYRSARYQGIVLSVKTETDIPQVQTQIEGILLEHDIWSSPGVGGAPDIPCSRRNFLDAVFRPRARGLAILSPLEWMIDWSDQDRATFWNAIADHYGRHVIVALCVATPPILRQLRVSLVEYGLPRLPVSVWLSRHQPVDHLEGVLK